MSSKSSVPWKDTAYVPTGGKHGVPKVAAILNKIGVPIKAVFDIDFLSEQKLVKSTVEAFGGNWDECGPVWSKIDHVIRNGNLAKSVDKIKEEIILLLQNKVEIGLPKSDVTELMKQTQAWSHVKKYGISGIPETAKKDFGILQIKLEAIGIYLIPVGEIENFCPQGSAHGPKFVTRLLSKVPFDDTRLIGLREFVTKVHEGSHSRIDTNENLSCNSAN